MADIDVRKKSNAWVWIVLLLVVLALIIWFAIG